MRIGYACINIEVPNSSMKRCKLINVNDTKLLDLISQNLDSLEKIIDYNIRNKIFLFRISSDLIPFGSSPVNQLPWWDLFQHKFDQIHKKIVENNIRVSMHPGQYTVLNSPNEDVVKRAIADLEYHIKVLDCLDVGEEHKIILHIGGVFNDKRGATSRFIDNFKRLDSNIKRRIVIENDDKSFNINDVLEISSVLEVPVVFDNLHNEINPYDNSISDVFWINECKKTWKIKDGIQKIHYSQQDPNKKPGSHSQSIIFDEFLEFYNRLNREDIDIMLEVKDKNLSAVNCINNLSQVK